MKKLITLVAVLAATGAQAEQDICSAYGSLSAEAMRVRHAGVPLSQALSASEDEFVRAVLREAYSRPRMSTDRGIERSVQDFRNDVELACYEAIQ